jgi:hypothetical protein
VVYGSASGEPVSVPTQPLVYRGLSVVGYSMGAHLPPQAMAAGLQALVGAAAGGRLRLDASDLLAPIMVRRRTRTAKPEM